MDKKLIGTAAVIGVVAGYMYSKDIFNSDDAAAKGEKETGEEVLEEGGEQTVPADTSGDDEGTTSTDWCAVKANSPKMIKAIPSQIESEIAKATKKVEKEGAAELARLEARYEKSKKKCSAKEEVQKKLQDSGASEGFWEKLLAFLNT